MRDIIYFFKLLAEERYCRELTLWKLFKQAIITQVLMIWENMLFQNCRIYALSLHIKMYSVGNQIQMDENVLKTDMSHWPRFCPLFLHTSPSTLWVLLVFLPLFLCLPVLTPALDSQTNLNIYPNSMHLHCTHFSCTFSAA